MSEKLGWTLAGVLFAIFVVLSFVLARTETPTTRVPVFLPLMSDSGGGPPPPGPGPAPGLPGDTPTGPPPSPTAAPQVTQATQPNTELAGVESMEILRQTGRLAATVSIEDFARGLLMLEEEGGELALTDEQKMKLQPIIKRAYERRAHLMGQQIAISEHEVRLPEEAAEAAEILKPKQRRAIRKRRDITSVEGVEDEYWEDLVDRLEEGPDE